MSAFRRTGSVLAAALFGVSILASNALAQSGSMAAATAPGLKWTPLVVPGFPAGAKMAVVHGNPGAAEDYVIRLRFPKGYAFPLHWHPGVENLTVLTGVFHLGMEGEKKSKTYTAGDYLYIPGRMAHFGGARTASTIQLHGVGPFAINLGSPK